MLAATIRSCFGSCFRRVGQPVGYDNIEDSGEFCEDKIIKSPKFQGNGYTQLGELSLPLGRYDGLGECRSKSTGEIFSTGEETGPWMSSGHMRPDRRSFSANFGYLDPKSDLWIEPSAGTRSVQTSVPDMRSDGSEAFWSCRGSIGRSSVGDIEGVDFYSEESDDPHEREPDHEACEACGLPGKRHTFAEQERCNWRETSLTSSLPVPRSEKWIQLE